jgi:PAS domain S-box-containing protein
MLSMIIHFDVILKVVAALIVVAAFFEKVVGVTLTGKKIYKGAPALWKRIMVARTFRLEMRAEVKEIRDELKYNGGSSTKDMIKMLIDNDSKKTQILERLESGMNDMRLIQKINDITSDQMKFSMDHQGSCTFINEAFLKMFGYTWRDLEGFNWESVIHDDDIEEVQARWKSAIQKRSRYTGEQRIVCANGECKYVRVTGYPIVENGELKGFYGTVEIIHNN